MYQHERHARLVELADLNGIVTVVDASDEFGVSVETIRRDLAELQRAGKLRRVHGGAVPLEQLHYEPMFEKRLQSHVEEKQRIARAAIKELPESGVLMVDAGTTPRLVCEAMPSNRRYTVVTNAVPSAVVLARKPNVDVLLVGGTMKADTMAVVGVDAVMAIKSRLADVAILGTDGMSSVRGLTTHAPDEAFTKEAMIASSRRSIVVADHSKYGASQLATFAAIGEVDTIVTDDGLSTEAAADLEQWGPRVERA